MDEASTVNRLCQQEPRKWHDTFQYDELFAPYKPAILATPRAMYVLSDDPCLEGLRAYLFHLSWQFTIVSWWGREKGAAFALESLVWQHLVYSLKSGVGWLPA